MSDSVIFDTHACVKRMTEAGVEPHVAEAFAAEQVNILEHHIATKTDIEALRKDMKALVLQSKNELIKWFVAGLFLSAGLAITGIGLLLQVFFNFMNN